LIGAREEAPIDYNTLAGRALDRIWNLSDNVFAFAMTILVLQVRLPEVTAIHNEAELAAALFRMWPVAATYVMSFVTLGIYWVAHQTQQHLMARSDRNAAWLHLAYLLPVVFMPFSTRLLTEFIQYRTALLFYRLNIVLLGATFLVAWNYAVGAGLLKANVDAETIAAVRRRVVVGQGLYAIGAALCVFGVAWSIGFIFLLQLNYALAPPIPWLRRLTT
jgi:uncharacterized membrane protein